MFKYVIMIWIIYLSVVYSVYITCKDHICSWCPGLIYVKTTKPSWGRIGFWEWFFEQPTVHAHFTLQYIALSYFIHHSWTWMALGRILPCLKTSFASIRPRRHRWYWCFYQPTIDSYIWLQRNQSMFSWLV